METKVEKLERELAEAKKQQAEFDALAENQKLAECLHSHLCRSSHEDQCGWYYENWKNIGSTRASFLKKADAILKDVDYKSAILMLKHI